LLYRFSLFTTLCGFILVTAGALVTSTGSGLAVPDWPLSFGTLFPPMVGGVRFEHSHRVIAATVGLLTLIQMIWILIAESRKPVRWLAMASFGMVVVQGLLGGITVLLKLPPQISIAHAVLGQTFFSTLTVLTMVLSPTWYAKLEPPVKLDQPPVVLFQWTVITLMTLYGQLVLGAAIRHLGWFPLLIIAHLVGAAAVFVAAGKMSGEILSALRPYSLFRKPAVLIVWVLLGQIGLGFVILVTRANALVATAHVAFGALLLASCWKLLIAIRWRISN
jgi:cytochrome c oxidase assembly protein subunit 15